MKKTLLLTLLLAAFFVVRANPVDVNTAKEIGAKFLKVSKNVKQVSALELVATYNIERGDAAFYVFNAENAFVIVAADDCAHPILAYSDEGRFDVEDLPIQMQEYLGGFVERIEYGIVNSISADEKTSKQWESVKTTGRIGDNRNTASVAPLLSSSWHQNSYYNRMCPEDYNSSNDGHVLAGCVATAMGQIMYYHKKPINGQGSHSYTPTGYPTQTANFGATVYDWANMTDKLDASSTDAEINAVATLLWHCGVSVEMKYGVSVSNANSHNVPDALLSYFRYSTELIGAEKDDYDDAVWLARVKACLDLNRPLYYSGTSVSSNGTIEGHAFVCDGYDTDEMLHMNWGWGGKSNCWVVVDVVKVGGYQFKYYNYAIFNIHPNDDGITTTHNVSVSSNNTALGTVTGGGTNIANGAEMTITATTTNDNIFCYWAENGGIVSTDETYTFNVYYSRNIEAVFAEPNSITIAPSVYSNTGGRVSSTANYSYGTTVTVTATPDDYYVFCYWLEGTEIVSTDNPYSFTATGDRNLVARFAEESLVCEVVYQFIDTYGDGWTGNKLNVVYEDTFTETMELSDGFSGYFIRNVVDGGKVKLSWQMGLYTSECQFALRYNTGVMFYEKSGLNASYSYTFNMNCSGGTDDVFEGDDSTLWSEASNWRSGSLPATTAITDIKSDVDVDVDVTVATMNLYDNVTLTINSGNTLTVTGTIIQLPDSKIVIEDGGQLVNLTSDVDGVVKKNVTSWTTMPSDDGWYAISTPINNIMFESVTNLTNEIYNIYRYNEVTTTWENSQNSSNPFNVFESGRGYLYRRNVEATLEFNGVFNTSYVGYQLSYTESNGHLKGFHLIGNPYTHNIYKGANTAFYNYNYLEDGFYTLQTNGTWQAGTDNSTAIKPCEAILVQAKGFITDNDILYFINSTSSGVSKEADNIIKFAVSNSKYEDVAYAVIKEGKGLNKIEHQNKDVQMLYIRNNDEDYAVADINEEMKAFDLNFKSATSGYYSMKVSTDGDFSYLHVIDRLTGEDVDMLVEGEYSFVSSPNDTDERFVVKLAPNTCDFDDDSFAFQNGDDLIVNGEGMLQIYDITGRFVMCREINGVETINASSLSGAYILRVVGNDVKSQKIFVE